MQSPWAGVLYLNYAIVNPAQAYPALRKVQIDDGQTRSYSLYLAATRPNFFRRSMSINAKSALTKSFILIKISLGLAATLARQSTNRKQSLLSNDDNQQGGFLRRFRRLNPLKLKHSIY